MSRLRTIASRVLDMFGRRRADERLDEEIRAHLDKLTDDQLGAGSRTC